MKWSKTSFKICCIVIMCSCAGKKSVVSDNTRTFDLSTNKDEVTIMWGQWNLPQEVAKWYDSHTTFQEEVYDSHTVSSQKEYDSHTHSQISPDMGFIRIVKKSSQQSATEKVADSKTVKTSGNYNGYYILLTFIICICAIKLLSLWSN